MRCRAPVRRGQRQAWALPQPDAEAWRQRLRGLHTIVAKDTPQALGLISYEVDGHIDVLCTAPHCAYQGVAFQRLAMRRPPPP